ncbi:MAG: NADH-quinone oxidoreductase subunit NuoF [Clostridia bacterium]|nr:NADH-quinone oxidoreductase subunit NuoF [Clostridia bacterium]
MSSENITKKLLTARFGTIDPGSIDDYIASGGYEVLKKAFGMSQDEVINEVKASGLKGRGGAGFPTGLKMDSVRQAEGTPKYIICNADEGEPGNFKDRLLMENDPHQIIEGMIICAYATGISYGFVFIRGEYMKSIGIMEEALEQARVKGFLGDNILDTGFDFDIEVHTGAGSYVCGEEFALLVSIEGKSGRATYKPPFPTTNGLYDKPTQINNVETFCNIPHIIDMGGAEYSKIGTESSKGTKLICLSGNVINPGLYEVPLGTSVRAIVDDLGGGVPNNRAIKMVQLGGASGPVIPDEMLDVKLDFAEMREKDLTFGSGAVIVMDERINVLNVLKRTLEFFHHESCGKCTPCREGLTQMLILLDRFIEGTATQQDLALLDVLIETMGQASICGLGQAAPTAVKKVLEYFPEEFNNRIRALGPVTV